MEWWMRMRIATKVWLVSGLGFFIGIIIWFCVAASRVGLSSALLFLALACVGLVALGIAAKDIHQHGLGGVRFYLLCVGAMLSCLGFIGPFFLWP